MHTRSATSVSSPLYGYILLIGVSIEFSKVCVFLTLVFSLIKLKSINGPNLNKSLTFQYNYYINRTTSHTNICDDNNTIYIFFCNYNFLVLKWKIDQSNLPTDLLLFIFIIMCDCQWYYLMFDTFVSIYIRSTLCLSMLKLTLNCSHF